MIKKKVAGWAAGIAAVITAIMEYLTGFLGVLEKLQ